MRKGFTIIECLISILLLAIIMAGGMAFYSLSHQYLRASMHKRTATEIANTKMEEIKNIDYALLPDYANWGTWTAQSATNIDIDNKLKGVGQQTVYARDIDEDGDSVIDYKEIAVEINWQEPGKPTPQSVRLDTYIAP